jgi:hypothetical protein
MNGYHANLPFLRTFRARGAGLDCDDKAPGPAFPWAPEERSFAQRPQNANGGGAPEFPRFAARSSTFGAFADVLNLRHPATRRPARAGLWHTRTGGERLLPDLLPDAAA